MKWKVRYVIDKGDKDFIFFLHRPNFYCSGSAAVTVMIKGYKQDKKM